jgi:uncharacterized phage-associated protein
MPGPFRLNIDKAIQAAAFVLREHSSAQRLNYMKLLKLMYLAERESLRERGTMITGDRAIAMRRGPLLGGIYDLIKGEHVAADRWEKYIERDGYHVYAKGNPGVGKLSKAEIETLRKVVNIHREHDEWEMVNFTHELDEWKKNDPGTSSRPIPLRDILEAVGRAQEADAIIEEAEKERAFDAFFGTHCACGPATPS